MAIKTYTTGQISFLSRYEPYSVPTGLVLCEFIDDMVSVDLQPILNPTNIVYYVGSDSTYVFTVDIKNLTVNATLNVKLPFSDQIFIIQGGEKIPNNSTGFNRSILQFVLNPREQRQIIIGLNKTALDTNANYETFDVSLPLDIQNIVTDGSLVFKEASVQTLSARYLPQDITIQ